MTKRRRRNHAVTRAYDTLLPELVALDAYRLRHDFSWNDLAEEMTAANQPMSSRTLNYLCRRAPMNGMVRDRTLLKIRRFLRRKKVKVKYRNLPRPSGHTALHRVPAA